MRSKGANGVGRFSIQFEITNDWDLLRAKEGLISPEQVRRMTIEGVVDPGASCLVLPLSAVKHLGLKSSGKVQVRYADRRTARRDRVEGVRVDLLGRQGTYAASVEPKRNTPLIGAIVLEDLDLLVDCTHQRLVPVTHALLLLKLSKRPVNGHFFRPSF